MIKKRVLIHWHPQGAYFGRAIFNSDKYLKANGKLHIGVVIGSNFLPQTNQASMHFIQELCILGKQIGSNISFELIKLPHYMESYTLYKQNQENINGNKSDTTNKALSKLEFNSIHDSLGRGLEKSFSNYHYMTDSRYKSKLMHEREEYYRELCFNYDKVIDSFRPDIVTVSHGTYDHFIAPFSCATSKNIKVMVVNGGCNMSYVHDPFIHPKSDPCIANAFSEIVNTIHQKQETFINQLPSFLRKEITHSPSKYLNNSSSDIVSNSKIYNQKGKKSDPLAILPIFAELNHHNCLKDVEFSSRYEWLEWMFKISYLSNRCLYIYRHPKTKDYNQIELTSALLTNAHSKYPCKYIIIKDLDHLSELSKDLTLIPMTMASSLSLELNKLGKISSVSNYSTSTPLQSFHRSSKTDSYEKIEAEFFEQSLTGTLNSQIMSAAKLSLQFNSYNVKKAQDYFIRKSFDKLFWFGGFNQNSPHLFIKLINSYIAGHDVCIVKTTSFDQLVTL